jgi:hypothetical protein
MTTVTFKQYVKAWREISIEISDLESFKEKVVEHIEQEENLNHWDCENSDFDNCCSVEYGEFDWEEEDNDEFYEQMLELKIPTNSEEVEEFLVESNN